MAERFLGKKEVVGPIPTFGSDSNGEAIGPLGIYVISIFVIDMAKTAKKSKYSENLIKLQCTVCKRYNYYTRKNKKLVERKIELSKYCQSCKKHTPHKETKKK